MVSVYAVRFNAKKKLAFYPRAVFHISRVIGRVNKVYLIDLYL